MAILKDSIRLRHACSCVFRIDPSVSVASLIQVDNSNLESDLRWAKNSLGHDKWSGKSRKYSSWFGRRKSFHGPVIDSNIECVQCMYCSMSVLLLLFQEELSTENPLLVCSMSNLIDISQRRVQQVYFYWNSFSNEYMSVCLKKC
jgi:hypothetical protein